MAKYRKRQGDIEAVRWHEGLEHPGVEWIPHPYGGPCLDKKWVLREGDWIITKPDGTREVIGDEWLREHYEETPAPDAFERDVEPGSQAGEFGPHGWPSTERIVGHLCPNGDKLRKWPVVVCSMCRPGEGDDLVKLAELREAIKEGVRLRFRGNDALKEVHTLRARVAELEAEIAEVSDGLEKELPGRNYDHYTVEWKHIRPYVERLRAVIQERKT